MAGLTRLLNKPALRDLIGSGGGLLRNLGVGGGSTTVEIPSLTELSYSQTSNPGDLLGEVQGYGMKHDGTKIYVVPLTVGYVYSNALSTPFDLSTMSATEVAERNVDIASGTDYIKAVAFSSDGLKFYTSQYATDGINQYNLSTAYDIGSITATPDESLLVLNQCSGFHFSSDGTKLALCGASSVVGYTLSTAWDISTATISGTAGSVAAQMGICDGIVVSDDGTRLWAVNEANAQAVVRQYTLSTPWQFNTMSYDSISLTANTAEPYCTSMWVIPGEKSLYLGYYASPGVDDCIVERYTWA